MNENKEATEQQQEITQLVELISRTKLPFQSTAFLQQWEISQRIFAIRTILTVDIVKKFLFNLKEALLTGIYKKIYYPFELDQVNFPLAEEEYVTLNNISQSVLDQFDKLNLQQTTSSLSVSKLFEIPPTALKNVFWYRELNIQLEKLGPDNKCLSDVWSNFLLVCSQIVNIPTQFTFDDFFRQLLENKILFDQIGDIGNVGISYFIINALKHLERIEHKHIRIISIAALMRDLNKTFSSCPTSKLLIQNICLGRFDSKCMNWISLYEFGHILPQHLDFIQQHTTTRVTAKNIIVLKIFNMIYPLINNTTCTLIEFKHIYSIILTELNHIMNLIIPQGGIQEQFLFSQITSSMCNLTKLADYILKLPKLTNFAKDIKRKYYSSPNVNERESPMQSQNVKMRKINKNRN